MPKKSICEYCTHFRLAGLRGAKTESEDAEIVHSRKCKIKKELVRANDTACKEFEMYHNFWCIKTIAWLDFRICLNRQEKQVEGCVRCKQGKYIKEILDV